MINVSSAYKSAMTADRRQIFPRAVVRVVDPDASFSAVGENSFYYSKPAQLTDGKFASGDKFTTFEKNRWILDGSFREFPAAPRFLTQQVGYISNSTISADNPAVVVLNIENADSLSSCGIAFSTNAYDGVAADFVVEIVGDTTQTITVTDNTAVRRDFDGFSVSNPTAVVYTFTRWSIPSRRARVIEVYGGIFEEWDESVIVDIDVIHETDISNNSMPNGSCELTFYNENNRFNPLNRSGAFGQLEARQAISISFGTNVQNGVEYCPLGKFYMTQDSWKTNADGMSMTFILSDLIGLVKDRIYAPPSTYPTTLAGWISSVLSTLGANFSNLYTIDGDVANTTITTSDTIENVTCGSILQQLAQASLGYMYCDPVTGNLRVSAFPDSAGTAVSFSNMSEYPTLQNRGDIAKFIFRYSDAGEFTIPGTQDAADEDIEVSNIFIQPNTIAGTLMNNMKKLYGTPEITVVGRGNPASELGDIDTVDLPLNNTTQAYLYRQQLRISGGIMEGVTSKYLGVKA